MPSGARLDDRRAVAQAESRGIAERQRDCGRLAHTPGAATLGGSAATKSVWDVQWLVDGASDAERASAQGFRKMPEAMRPQRRAFRQCNLLSLAPRKKHAGGRGWRGAAAKQSGIAELRPRRRAWGHWLGAPTGKKCSLGTQGRQCEGGGGGRGGGGAPTRADYALGFCRCAALPAAIVAPSLTIGPKASQPTASQAPCKQHQRLGIQQSQQHSKWLIASSRLPAECLNQLAARPAQTLPL